MSSYVLAIDQGTTSTRALIVDDTGAVRAVAQQPIPLTYPAPGWVNQDAEEIWQLTRRVCLEAIERAGLVATQISAIGITNQRETIVVWDRKSLIPVAPAIVWQSRQSASLVEDIALRGISARYTQITGLVPDAYFSATKLRWLFDHHPELRERAESGDLCAGTIDSWLIARLTNGKAHITDRSNASRTMLYDIRKLEWSKELLDELQIPTNILPAVVENSGQLATADASIFGAEIPITGAAGDQHAALFGQTCYAPGMAKNTYGTGSFLLMNTGTKPAESRNKLLTTIAWSLNGEVSYALEGAIFVTGAAIGWLRDGLGLFERASDVEKLAATVHSSEGVTFVPALTGLGAPYWDPDARGTILGLTRGSTKAHIARAALEAIAFQVRDVVDAMSADSGVPLSELRVDGGAASNDLLMQLQADLLGTRIVRPAQLETTAMGAAFLAGIGAGIWKSTAELERTWHIDRAFEPSITQDERDTRYSTWKRAVDRSRGWAS
jgi:glycerol kinase